MVACENKNGGTFHSFHQQQEIGELLAKTSQEQQEDNAKDDICYLENICETEQPLLPKLAD